MQSLVYWYQGLMLQPQHFQLLERSVDARLEAYHRFTSPNFHGLVQMELRDTVLEGEVFGPDTLEIVFEDGTHASFPGNAELKARSFADLWREDGESLTVYVGLKRFYEGRRNVAVLDHPEAAEPGERMSTQRNPIEVQDQYAGDGPGAKVHELKYVLRVIFEPEKEKFGDYQLVPLARLERDGKRITLSERFIPPAMSIASSEALSTLVRDVRDLLTARAKQLELYKQQRGVTQAEFGSRDMVYLLALISLSRYVPLLHHYTEAGNVSPWVVYGLLRSLVGELAAFSLQYDCLGEHRKSDVSVLAYDHQELWPCFDSLRTVIVRLLDELTAGPEYVLRLQFDGEYYSADMSPALFEGNKRYYLAVHSEEDSETVAETFRTEAKLSARAYLAILIAKALPGLGLKYLESPPQELPRRLGTKYYEIDRHGDQWTLVKKSSGISLFWPQAPEDMESEIMIVER